MSQFGEKELDKLAHLCRIACTPEEKQQLLVNLRLIFSYIDQLRAVETQGVAPCSYVADEIAPSLRSDEVGDTIKRKEFLDDSPAHVGGMIKVPPVISF